MAVATAELIERIWARDAGVWTGGDESRWLGWLDVPSRMRERVSDLESFAREAVEAGLTEFVLAGMGGSSLAPEVFRRTFGAANLHVLDTTHPDALRALDARLDHDRTLVVVSSKSGTTLETQCHLAWLWERLGERGDRFAAVTDPGSQLEGQARERGFRAIWRGEPEIGGRYSALSFFGLVPAALIDVDLGRLLERAHEMVEACQLSEGNPGLDLGRSLGEKWRDGRDKVLLGDTPGGFGLWVEQLIAESTGKEGKGLVPVPGEADDPGPDRQEQEVRAADPYELGPEFYRWEFATAVAGSLIGINPFDQPNVQEAKDRTGAILETGQERDLEPVSSLEELLAQAGEGDYACIQAFVEPTEEAERRIDALRERIRSETGVVTTAGFGPRYLHSTGQLHKGGPPSGLFLQLVDDPEELEIAGRDFGFRRLIRAQAAGDFDALRERGRRVARMRWEDVG